VTATVSTAAVMTSNGALSLAPMPLATPPQEQVLGRCPWLWRFSLCFTYAATWPWVAACVADARRARSYTARCAVGRHSARGTRLGCATLAAALQRCAPCAVPCVRSPRCSASHRGCGPGLPDSRRAERRPQASGAPDRSARGRRRWPQARGPARCRRGPCRAATRRTRPCAAPRPPRPRRSPRWGAPPCWAPGRPRAAAGAGTATAPPARCACRGCRCLVRPVPRERRHLERW
jgi:hypothetical protein